MGQVEGSVEMIQSKRKKEPEIVVAEGRKGVAKVLYEYVVH